MNKNSKFSHTKCQLLRGTWTREQFHEELEQARWCICTHSTMSNNDVTSPANYVTRIIEQISRTSEPEKRHSIVVSRRRRSLKKVRSWETVSPKKVAAASSQRGFFSATAITSVCCARTSLSLLEQSTSRVLAEIPLFFTILEHIESLTSEFPLRWVKLNHQQQKRAMNLLLPLKKY